MAKGCCSGCRTKYSIINPEKGCLACNFSFCARCIVYTTFSGKPMSMCFACHRKNSASNQSQNGNWWGEGRAPPSLRPLVETNKKPVDNSHEESIQRRLELLKREAQEKSLSSKEIEERLAAIKGIDVELVRNPRMWFNQCTDQTAAEASKWDASIGEMERRLAALKAEDEEPPSNPQMMMLSQYSQETWKPDTVMALIEKARSEAALEMKYGRTSTVSEGSRLYPELSSDEEPRSQENKEDEMTPEEVIKISMMLDAAEKRLAAEQRMKNKQNNNEIYVRDSGTENELEVGRIAEEATDAPEPVREERPRVKKNFFSRLFKR